MGTFCCQTYETNHLQCRFYNKTVRTFWILGIFKKIENVFKILSHHIGPPIVYHYPMSKKCLRRYRWRIEAICCGAHNACLQPATFLTMSSDNGWKLLKVNFSFNVQLRDHVILVKPSHKIKTTLLQKAFRNNKARCFMKSSNYN